MRKIFKFWPRQIGPRRNRKLILGLSFHIILCFLCLPVSVKAKEAIKVQNGKEKDHLAQLYKQAGDQFVLKNKYREAAQAYMKALSIARDSFSLEERTQLAIYISWGGKLKAALQELKLVLDLWPDNLKARLHLARVLSWMGRYQEALKQVNLILKSQPQNKEALLIKANVKRWTGDLVEAKSIYQSLLEKEEIFEARLGLIYTHLYLGERKQAFNHFNFLKPTYAYEKQETERLAVIMAREIDHSFEGRAFYYYDEDKNESYFYPLNLTFWLTNWRFDLNFQQRQARDKIRQVRAEDFFLRTYFKPKEFLGIGAGTGLLKFGHDQVRSFLTWNLKTDLITSATRAGFNFSRQGFNETAQLIKNEIRYINLNFYLSQKITDRFSFWTDFANRNYSDNNHARAFNFALVYRLHLYRPSFNFGYRIRHLNFKTQTYSGYFDPDLYFSHQVFITFYGDYLKFHLYFEPYAGYQSYRRYGQKINNWIGGGAFSFGWIISQNLFLEIKAEGGNFSLATATGWRYYLCGLRLVVSF